MNNQTDNKKDNKTDNLTLFITLCEILEDISKTKKRLEIQEILSNYFKKINNDSSLLITVLYLCTGRIAPDHYNKEMGIGETTIIKVVSEVTGLKVQKIKQEMSVTGDLGLIGMKKRVSQLFVSKQPKLTVFQVFHTLQSLSEEQGFKSINSKINKMISLISKSNPLETKYLIRLFEGKLKIGLALKTVLISLSQAFSYKRYDVDSASSITSSSITNSVLPITDSHIPHSTPHTYSLNSDCSEEVKFAYNKCPVFEELIPLLIKHGPYQLNNYCKMKCGIPLKPMLAQPHNNINNVYKKLQNTHFTCEYKYDGERAQIHKFDNTFMVFSRNSENLTEKYPDLEVNISKFPYKNFILDTEIVAFDFCNQKILPFQLLSTRKRKEVRVEDIQIEIQVFIFDILFFEDTELLQYPLQHRRNILIKYFSNPNTKFKIVTFKDISDVDSKVDFDLDSKLDNGSKLNGDNLINDKNIINSISKDNNKTEDNNINNDSNINNNITED
ncbi:DNA ligase, partial [Hamiltosporidium tvaerminnensis]